MAAHADFDIPCRFFSSLIQRAAKVHRRSGGGSLTMLAVLPGSPATGRAVSPASVVAQYKHLSEAQKQKLLAALEARQHQQTAAESSSLEEGRVRTEVRRMPTLTFGALLLIRPTTCTDLPLCYCKGSLGSHRDPCAAGWCSSPVCTCCICFCGITFLLPRIPMCSGLGPSMC